MKLTTWPTLAKHNHFLSLILFASLSLIALPSFSASRSDNAVAIFAGGCFWCMEPPFDKLEGVKSTVSGYIGGHKKNPTYKEVSSGRSGHYEVVKIEYDASKVSYQTLLDVYWKNIDPLNAKGQFCDEGQQYASAIFYLDDEQKALSEKSKQKLIDSKRFNKPIVTEILAASTFYPAEEYHQNYYQKNPIRYKFYRTGCGRDRRLNQLWGDS